MAISKTFPSWWLHNGWRSVLLTPFSWIVQGVTTLRKFYHTKLVSPYIAQNPIIVVGNITVGGTGKTPMVLHVAKCLKQAGYKPAIISKGYGGTHTQKSKRILCVNEQHDVRLVGDEPLMMARANVATVIIGHNRVQALKWLTDNHPHVDCVISDDGLHDRSFAHDIEIAMVDGERMLGNGKIIPAGPLREAPTRLHSVDHVVVTASCETQKIQPMRGIDCHATMLLHGDKAINIMTHETRSLISFVDCDPLAIAGIGNPQRFFSHLRQYIPNLNERSFGDHHDYSCQDQLPTDQSILMTSKDAVKFRAITTANPANHWEVPVEASLPESFNQAILNRLKMV